MRRNLENITGESDVPLAHLQQWRQRTELSHQRRTGQPSEEAVNNDDVLTSILTPHSQPFEDGQHRWQQSTATKTFPQNLIDLEEITTEPITRNMNNMDFLKDFTDSMGQLLTRFTEVSRQPVPERATLVETFAGEIEEDPERYINAVDNFITKNKVMSEIERMTVARRGLLGEAKQWADVFKNTPMLYNVFVNRFFDEFNSPRRKVAAYSKFYVQHQSETESSEAFISRKQALLARLRTNMDPETTVEMVISLLKPAIASRIVGFRPVSLEELVRTVRRIEPEVEREYKAMRSDVALRSTRRPAVPYNPCRWCGGRHYYRECPENPYDNIRQQQSSNQNQGNVMRAGEDNRPPQNSLRSRGLAMQEVNAQRRQAGNGGVHSSNIRRDNRGREAPGRPLRSNNP